MSNRGQRITTTHSWTESRHFPCTLNILNIIITYLISFQRIILAKGLLTMDGLDTFTSQVIAIKKSWWDYFQWRQSTMISCNILLLLIECWARKRVTSVLIQINSSFAQETKSLKTELHCQAFYHVFHGYSIKFCEIIH